MIADVYKAGRLAATLARSGPETVFTYLPEYLRAGGPPVATTLPLSSDSITTGAGAVPAFFAGLLPEGRRLNALRRAVKTSADDDLSLLIAVGSDPVGDVQVLPQDAPPVPAPPLVAVRNSFDEVSFAEVLGASGVIDRVALAGVQDKASAGMISVPATRAGRRYLLKVDPPEYPGVVLDEAFFIAVARRVGINVVEAEVVRDVTGRPGLLVERFDRLAVPGDQGVRRIAVEDGAQVLGRYPADKYHVTAETVVTALADVCAARVVAVQALFSQLCFAWLTGNGDVHAKNLSVLSVDGTEWRVAPAYDIPSTLPYGDTTMALTMRGKASGLSRRSLLGFADDVGLPGPAAVRVLDRLLAGTTDLEAALDGADLPFTAAGKRTLIRGLRNRRRAALPSGGGSGGG